MNCVKPNSTRNKYNILSFQFACYHECHEGKWGKCKHCISRTRCVNTVRPVYPSEQGIYYPTERIEIALKTVEDLGFYVHEFTEAAIVQVMLKFRKDWHRFVEFKGYKSTYVTHFISMYGANNQTCLEPVTKRNRPKW